MSDVLNRQQFKKPLLVLLAVVILAGGITAYILFGKMQPFSESSYPKLALEQEQVFSYVGSIQSLSDDGFVILTEKGKNFLDKDTNITVKVSSETQFIGFAAPQVLPSKRDKETLNKLFKTENISFSDLKAGDEVTVVSQTDVAGKTTIDAAMVQRIKQSR